MDRVQDCMTDFWRSAIRQQFHAAIDMLANAIEACPESSWSAHGQSAFWYIGFHTLIFLDLYLSSEGEPQFHPPPPFTRSELEDEVVVPEPGYKKEELLGYVEHCRFEERLIRRSASPQPRLRARIFRGRQRGSSAAASRLHPSAPCCATPMSSCSH